MLHRDPRASFLARLAAASLLALTPLVAGCTEQPASSEEDVTDVLNSSVKNQSIGNCWIYATMGWAESLHLTHTGTELNLSESWISYWHWYEQLAGAPPGLVQLSRLDKDQLSTGGWFGLAAEIARRYGVIAEGAFIPEEAEAARSSRQSQALSAINTSLKSGALKDAAARKDRKLVRAELDKAWGLTPALSATLDAAFGADVSRALVSTGVTLPAGSPIQATRTIAVGRNITLADAFGEPITPTNILQRKGKYAWNEAAYPTSPAARRELQRRMQAAMHEGMPVILTWFVDFGAMSGSAFKAPPASPGHQGGHMTVVEDYQISNVPGFGTLEAGTLVTDPKALEAALAPEATLDFVRIKNSWGLGLAPAEASEEFRGYYDLHAAYLDGAMTKCTESNGDKCGTKTQVSGATNLILPPAAFVTDAKVKEGSCGNICIAGPARPGACDACTDLICSEDAYCCASKWDEACVAKATEICDLHCK
ncbi:MAG: hypothetical protein FJ096_02985 [Deltaproteobacteria bacterium]|nr:hypothetical protein [Deltaproteobacteria bacterium]